MTLLPWGAVDFSDESRGGGVLVGNVWWKGHPGSLDCNFLETVFVMEIIILTPKGLKM